MNRSLLAALIAVSFISICSHSKAQGQAGVQGSLYAQTEETLDSLYAKSIVSYKTDVSSRIKSYAQYFLNQKTPYMIDPLGEGANGQFSQNPLYRFDGFDCTTFVETVISLALSHSSAEFKNTINQVRYKNGLVSYEARNHFPSVDWIPNNTRAGFVRDITKEVAGSATKLSQTWIEKGAWFSRKGVDYQQLAQQFSTELGKIPYISKEDILSKPELVNRIPSGSVFHVVRPNWDLKAAIGTQLDVSHEGFLIREEGKLYMIHASNGAARDGSDNDKRVKKELLTEYVRRVMLGSLSTAGINIVQVLDKNP